AFELLKNQANQIENIEKQQKVLSELGMDKFKLPNLSRSSVNKSNNLIRIGIVGYGWRAGILANALGYIHPDDAQLRNKKGTLESWLMQEDINVAITGICDVFDLHAQKGLETARSEIRSGGASKTSLEIKRYRHYHEMLESKDIDAVIIATPEHHHAQMTIDAVKAGKHVYCEKSFTRTEQELYDTCDAVRNSNVVFQLGHQITKNSSFKYAKEIIDKDLLGKITLIEATSNRNTANGAWIRHRDSQGNLKPGDENSIDWKQWLGSRPDVPFSADRFYNWTKWFDYSTGLLGQLFTHEFDAINQLLHIGIPKSVMTSGGIYYWKDNREIPDVLNAVFEYPEKELTLVYSASLANSRQRGRVIMGHDASMEIGGSLSVTPDGDSTRYADKIEEGLIDPTSPMLAYGPQARNIDGVSSATEKYYVSRGLADTSINGSRVSTTHLHVKEWIDCIRHGGTPSGNIEMAFEEGITVQMAHKSYMERRRVDWDPVKHKIV
uniref:Gfo/Idh/MocA family protein n=1 Tax=Mariniphaga sediminis TaxID=1628158 RepID=UPI0035656E3F